MNDKVEIDLDIDEIRKILSTQDEVLEVMGRSGLDTFGMIAVLTKTLVDYAVLVEDRDEFNMRMAMTYDFVKSMQSDNKELH